MPYYFFNKSLWKTGILVIISFIFAISLIKYPDNALQASLRGITVWWDVVLPALFPFFIVSEVLIGLGAVHFMSVLLEPFMRPLFNVPGSGAFVMTMGFASGFPMSSKITTKLREQKLLTRSEGERLVCFTTTSDPLFIFGAVSVGFFHDATLGIILIVAHYAAAIILGLCMRYYDRHSEISQPPIPTGEMIFVRAVKAMHRARLEDNRPLGKLLGDAVLSSLQTLALIGGFMILMSVLIALLDALSISAILSNGVSLILAALNMSVDLSGALVAGLFEVTLGSQETSLVLTSSLLEQMLVVGMILAWGGFSVHAQIAAILSTSDLRYKPFIISRIVHAILAAFLTLVIWDPLSSLLQLKTLPTFLTGSPALFQPAIWDYWKFAALICVAMLTVIFIFSMVFHTLHGIRRHK